MDAQESRDGVRRAVARTNERLCGACQRMCGSNNGRLRAPEGTQDDTHQVSALDCQRAVQYGCPICMVVWRHATADGTVDVAALKLEAAFSTWSVSTNGERDEHQRHRHWSEDAVTLTISTGSVSYARGLGPMHVIANDHLDFALVHVSQRQDDIAARRASGNTGSDATWKQIDSWLTTCVVEHGCTSRKATFHEGLPSRLIQIGTSPTDAVRIVANTEQACRMPYVALSHCWGGKSALVLYDETRDRQPANDWITLEKPEAAINRLPRTFHDAVTACRRLKVSYLWIDSLCIVQNSAEDWDKESKKMWSIYGSAFCTLAADGAPDSDGGLFHERDSSAVQPLIVDWLWSQGRAPFALIYCDYWKNNVADSLLGKRGWTLQERYLSSVIIHFNRDQVFWECRDSECSETYPGGIPKHATDTGARFKSSSLEASKFLRSAFASSDEYKIDHEADDSTLDRYYLWSRLVEKYTRTSLSFDKDKLIAIYGLGLYFQYLLRESLDPEIGVYVAGLWMDILPSQLMWSVEDNRTVAVVNADQVSRNSAVPLARRPSERNAPSWSWASVVGPVVMPKPLRTGSLVKLMLDGPDINKIPKGKGSAQGFMQDMADVFGSHQNVMLRVTAGRLHMGRIFYGEGNDLWSLLMDPVGFPFQHHQGSDATSSAASGGDDARATVGTLMSHSFKKQFGENALGIAQLDTQEDVPSGEGSISPVVCLPVIDTRRCGKRALRADINYSLDGVSGLLLVPAGWEFPGFYQRIGNFHLVRGASEKLVDTTAPLETYRDIFLPYDPHTIRLV